MITDFLTQDEREKGARMLVGHSFFNGLGFGFLAETIIYLLALQFNASNTQLGYISSAVHIAGLSLFVLPRLTHGINLRKIYFGAWIARGAAAIVYFFTFFAHGPAAVYIILAGYTLFCISRIVGVAMAEPVQQMLATSTTRGQLVSRFFISFQLARMFSQLLSFGFTSFELFDEHTRLLVLIGIGIVCNTIAAFFLRGIPFREKSRYQKGSSLPAMFLRTVRDRERILVILVRCLSLSAAVVIGFIIPFLRVIIGLEQNMVFLFSLVGSLGMIASGLLLRPFVDSVGSKPLLMVAFFGQFITLAFWMLLRSGIGLTEILILGFITTVLQAAVFQLVARLVINVIPSRDKIGFTSMLNFITALFAFGSGLLGGYLIDLGELVTFAWGTSYSLTFAAGALMNIAALIIVLNIRDRGSLRIREAAGILFSARNLKTFLDIYNFHLTDNPVKKQTILTSINYSPAPQAEPELRQILNNPIAADKDQILISLYKNPRPRLLDLIILEAQNPDSPHQGNAIFALGAYPQEESRQALYQLYESSNVMISCAAAKSLARIESAPLPGELEKILIRADLPTRAIEDLMIALSVSGNESIYLSRIFSLAPCRRGRYHQQAVLALAARLENFTPPLDEIYARENEEHGTGLALILEEARSFKPFFDSLDTLRRLYADGEYSELLLWCNRVAGEYQLTGHLLYSAVVVNQAEEENAARSLARLYFIFQLLNGIDPELLVQEHKP